AIGARHVGKIGIIWGDRRGSRRYGCRGEPQGILEVLVAASKRHYRLIVLPAPRRVVAGAAEECHAHEVIGMIVFDIVDGRGNTNLAGPGLGLVNVAWPTQVIRAVLG